MLQHKLHSLAAGAGEVTNLYSVSYNTNNSTGGTTPPTQTAESNSKTYTFITPTAKEYGLIKTNHGFLGWANSPSATNPDYQAGSSIELTPTSPVRTLYAVWKPWNMMEMQNMTPSLCSQMDNTEKQFTDSRDGKKYWVSKLADGNCWMTQNLDLDLNGVTLTPDDSDVGSSWKSSTGASNLWSSTGQNDIKYYDPGLKFCNTSACNLTSSTNNGHDAQGNYYSFNAATAGTGQNYTTDGQNAPDSICPKGWKLPLSGNSNGLAPASSSESFGLLLNKQLGITNTSTADTNLLKAPLYFIRSGDVSSGKLNIAGSRGYYWSSTAYSGTTAYYLYFNSSTVNPSASYYRYNGLSVRCVAK